MKLFFSPSIDEREWSVWKPVVKLGEYQHRFFFYVDVEDTDKRELITPPRGLYGKEFLELDYGDPFQLMAFQQKWGPITGLRTRPNTSYDYKTHVDLDCLGGIGSTSIPDGFQNTVFLYKGYGEADIIAKERYGAQIETLGDLVQENWRSGLYGRERKGPVPCHVASVEEVAEAVCHAQIAITAITDCLKEGFGDDEWHSREKLVRNALRYCNSSIQSTVLPMDLIEDDDRSGVCTIMQYLFINMARGVMRNNTYRNCQNQDCRRLFTPAEVNRRADSRYCSSECQIKAKHQRTYKPKRQAEKAHSADVRDYADELKLSWSTSGAMITTLRKGEEPNDYLTALALAMSFNGLTCGRPDDEYLIAHYGLDIPNPSAQAALHRPESSSTKARSPSFK